MEANTINAVPILTNTHEPTEYGDGYQLLLNFGATLDRMQHNLRVMRGELPAREFQWEVAS